MTYPPRYRVHQVLSSLGSRVLKWCMQNIAKTDTNSPGSTSQQGRCQERPLKAARNHRQACLNAETKEQRQAKLEVDRGTTT